MDNFFNKKPDFSSITYATPVKGGDGRYFVAASSTDYPDILCQFIKGIVCNNDLNETDTTIDTSLACPDTIGFIQECDEHFLAKAKDLKREWFPNQDISDSYLDQAFMNSIKPIKKQSLQAFKTRISKSVTVFDTARQMSDVSIIKDNMRLCLIVQLSGLWFTKTRFGLTWLVRQIKTVEPEKSLKIGSCLFSDEEYPDELDNVFPDE